MREEACDMLLGRGVQWRLPVPPPLRWLLPRGVRLCIRHLRLGTLLEIERLSVRHRLEERLLDQPPDVLAEITALAVLNDRRLIRLLRRPLTQWLLHYVTVDSLVELWGIILRLSRVEDFTRITASIVTMSTLTRPRTGHDSEEGR